MVASGIPADVVTAGTHVVENQPISRRTRAAIVSLGLEPVHHRSHQLTHSDVNSADLVVAMAAEHVRYVRHHHPVGAPRTATICYLARYLGSGTEPLGERVASLSLADVPPEAQGDVADPAGHEEPEYLACAKEISAFMEQLMPGLRP